MRELTMQEVSLVNGASAGDATAAGGISGGGLAATIINGAEEGAELGSFGGIAGVALGVVGGAAVGFGLYEAGSYLDSFF